MIDRILKTYYFSTPLWWLLDTYCGVNVRAAGFQSVPHLKQLYYGVCILCALAIWIKPGSMPFVVLGESSVDIIALILGVMGPIYRMGDYVGTEVAFENPVTVPYMINFCVAGTIAYLGFQRSQQQLLSRQADL